MTYTHLTTLAAVSPRTDADLFYLTQGTPPDVADLALALFHERTGQHAARACGVCDLAHVEALALDVLNQAGLTIELPAAVAAQETHHV